MAPAFWGMKSFCRTVLILLCLGRFGLRADEKPVERYAAFAAQETQALTKFPDGKTMAALGRRAVLEVTPELRTADADTRLLAFMEAEFTIYRAAEEKLCREAVTQPFANVDEFLAVAETITNRRKARAGRSLEEHVKHLLSEAGIAYESQATIDGKVRPDVLMPGAAAYNNRRHPAGELVVLGIKTTCKDRWRQVLNEGKRVKTKHLLTLQPEMSRAQLAEMQEAGLQLIVPAALHGGYEVPEGYQLLTVEAFLKEMRARFPAAK
jgi:hypothetical protein